MPVGRWLWAAAVAIGLGSAAPTTGPANAAVPGFLTGFTDVRQYQSNDAATRAASLTNTTRVQGTIVRLFIKWRDVAPTKPPSATAARQASWSGYQWARTDAVIRSVRDAGLQPLVMVYTAPAWAEGSARPPDAIAPAGTWRPSTSAFDDSNRLALFGQIRRSLECRQVPAPCPLLARMERTELDHLLRAPVEAHWPRLHTGVA